MVAGQWRSSFVYDGLNRRRITRDYSWNGSAWVETNEVRYIYDGLLVIQERDTNNNPLVTYTRGLDLSGDLWDACGIGGLLARTDTNGSTFYHGDGNGNVTALMDGNENIVARYLFNPFGKLIGQWGSMANANTMQFSSMPQHDGLTLYPFRGYEPNFQRWLNQDPIQEAGGINLYRFNYNNPLAYIDPYGLYSWSEWESIVGAGAGGWSDAASSIGQTIGGSLNTGYDAATGNWSSLNSDVNYIGNAQDLSQNSYDALAGLDPTGLLITDPCDKNANAGMWLGVVGGLATGSTELQFGKDANALIQLAKDARRTGVSPEDAETLLQWAKEYNVNPAQNHIGTTHWVGGDHIRIGPVNHIPVK
jgi:RHS repeat-associated protein